MVVIKNEIDFPWKTGAIVENIYKTDNYCIKNTGAKTRRAIIFFSGNGLYYPNTEETFEKVIIEKERYEWEKTAKSKVIQKYYEKIIFVRDVYKQWYVKGINDRIDDIDKVVQLLAQITEGYDITTCGNSAGGYMAVLIGIQIKASKMFSFSGQFSIEDELEKPVYESPYLHKYKGDKKRRCYFSLIPYLDREKNNIYYFYPGKCQYDIEQHELIKNSSIYEYKFDCASHGNTVQKECYPYVLTCDAEKLEKLAEFYKSCWIDKREFYKKLIPKRIRFFLDIQLFLRRLKDKSITKLKSFCVKIRRDLWTN